MRFGALCVGWKVRVRVRVRVPYPPPHVVDCGRDRACEMASGAIGASTSGASGASGAADSEWGGVLSETPTGPGGYNADLFLVVRGLGWLGLAASRV